jgi:transcriptional regulator with XRE-family HTH domain
MGESRVPTWYAATGLHGENRRVYDAFRRFLHNLPISYTALAESVGVSQPAVSRWASDVTHPSLDEMSAAVTVVRERLLAIMEEVDRFSDVLTLIDEAMRLYEVELEGRTDIDPYQRQVTEKLREELGLDS